MRTNRLRRFGIVVALAAGLVGLSARAASGTWNGTQNAFWTNSHNWSASPYAGFNTSESATFNSAGNNNTNLNIVGLYSLGNITFDTANVAPYTIGAGAPNSQYIVIGNTGNYKITSTAAHSQTFNAAVMLGGGATVGTYTFQNDHTGRLLTFNNIIVTNTGTAGTKGLTVTGAGDTTILGHMTKGTSSGIDLTKSGTGTLSLCGTNVIRALTVSGGTLRLTGDYGALAVSGTVSVASGATLRLDNTAAANNPNRLFNTAPLTLAGGTLDFAHAGGAANYSESVGPVTLSASGCTLSAAQADAGQTSTLTLARLTVNGGASVNFVGEGLGASDRNRIFITGQAEGPLGSWATLNGAAPVLYSAAEGVYMQASTDIAAYGGIIVSNDAANVRINTEGTTGPITLSEDITVVSGLSQNTAFGTSVNTAGKTLRLAAVSISPAMADLAIGVSPSDGTLSSKSAGGTLSLINDSASTLTVNAVVANNETASSLVKSGTGTVALAGANTFTGPVTVSGGTLLLAHSQALQNVLLGSITGIAFDSSVASHAFTVGNLTNAFALSLQDNAANPITLAVGNNGGSSSFGGVISGGGALNKIGAGKLALTVANSFAGGTTVSEGTLRAAHSGSLGSGGVVNHATLELPQGAVTYAGLSVSLSGSGTNHLTLGTGTETTYLDGDYSGFSGVWNIGVNAAAGAGKARMNGADHPGATLHVLSNATLIAAAPVVHRATAILYGGNPGQSYGQLRLDNGAEWAGPVVLAGDITDANDGMFGCYEGSGTISGFISDLGGAHPVRKINGTPIYLTCTTNTYAGQTWISNGRLGAASIRNVGEASSLGKPANVSDGTIRLGSGGNIVALMYLGTGDTSDRVIDLAGTTGGVTLDQAGSGPLTLTGGFTYSGSGSRTLTLDGSTAGTGELTGALTNSASGTIGLRKQGTGRWTLTGANTYGGSTVVSDGELVLSGTDGAILNTSAFTVYTNGVLRLVNTAAANNANRLADAKALTLNGGGTLDLVTTGEGVSVSESVGALTVTGVGNVIRTSQVADGQTAALNVNSLTRSANATLDFQGAGIGADDRNRIFITGQTPGLFGLWGTYNGTGLAAYDPARGVFAGTAFTTNIAARGPSVIPDIEDADVRITVAGETGPITLAGVTETRVGRLQQATATAAEVDTAAKTLRAHAIQINEGQAALTLGQNAGDGTLTPLMAGGRLDLINDDTAATLTVNATLSDNGAASSLAKSGAGNVVLRGATALTGPIAIANGTLTFGGHGVPQTVNGVISGTGALAKTGSSLLHLLAANTYTGPTYINQGVVRVNQGNAFGTTAGGVFIADGATLDVGCSADVGGTRTKDQLNMQGEPITVQGAGVGGLGAILNSSAESQYNAVGKVTLAGDTVFGGQSRWDIRDSWLVMNDHKLTKVGPSILSISSTTNAPGEAGTASIDVQEGQFRLQRIATLNGGPANVLTVRGGAEFEMYQLVNDVAWSLALEEGSALDSLTDSILATHNRITGPATLNGTVSLVGADNCYATLAGDLSGAGSLLKTNGSIFIVTGTNNTYAGPTLIRGGALHVASLRNVGEPSSLGQPADAAAGTIPIGIGSTYARLTYIGTGDTTDRVIDMAGTTGNAYLNHSGEGLLDLRNIAVSGAGSKTLYLEGSTSGVGRISGNIPNGPSGTVAVNKSGTGAWTLAGDNTYSGATTVNGGLLAYSGTNTLGGLAINAGTVAIAGSNAYNAAAAVTVGNSSGKNGALVLNPGSSLSCSSNFRIGNTGGFGSLLIDGGSFLNTASDGDQNFAFARENNSYGYLRMTGGKVVANRLQMSGVTGSSNIGRSLARISGGTLEFTTYVLIGRNVGCETVLTLDGGTLDHSNATKNTGLPWAGGRAELNVTGGLFDNSGRSVTLLEGGGTYGTGIVNLCSGTLTTDSVTNYASGVLLVNFAGGTLKASSNRLDFLPSRLSGVYSYGPFGTYAGGAVIDTAGRNVTVSAPVQAPAGQGVTAIAVAEQGSGYLGEPYVCIEGDGLGATAVANLADDGSGNGTYKVASVTVTCPGVNYTSATVLFKGGGATNTLVAAVPGTVSLAANTSGGLTKQGNGILTLGAANTYGGTTTVAGGTLKLGAAGALPTATQVTLAGGTLDLNGQTVTNAVSGIGTLANGAVRTVLSPAGEGAVGTDTVTLSGATLAGGTYLADVSTSGASDLVAVIGNISLTGFDLQLVNPELLNRHKIYTLLTCTGTRSGSFSAHNLPDSRWHLSYQADGSVKLSFAGGTLLRVL